MKEEAIGKLESHVVGLVTAVVIAVVVASFVFDIPLPKGALSYLYQ